MKAKKSYGQHFLAQPAIAEKIAQAVDVSDVEQILEVGPGQGMLTQFLLTRGRPLIAVEADRDMVSYLHNSFPEWATEENLRSADFLKVDLAALTNTRPTALVGNFPYNISSQILVRLVDYRDLFPQMVGMFQRELAERVLAPQGTRNFGAISALVQAFYRGRNLVQVKPGSFNPPPKVDSTVIVLERLPPEELPDCDVKILRQVIRTSFGQRRKMLRNSLKPIWADFDPEDALLMRRPEQLVIADFVEIARRVGASRRAEAARAAEKTGPEPRT